VKIKRQSIERPEGAVVGIYDKSSINGLRETHLIEKTDPIGKSSELGLRENPKKCCLWAVVLPERTTELKGVDS